MGNFSNYWDLHTLFTKLKNKLKSISDKIDDSVSLKTVTGNPIALTDAANANAEELSMTIEPIQSGSGDPSPTNVRPISGLTEGKVVACGKNIAHIDSTKIYSTDKDPSDPIAGIADGMLILGTASNGYIRGVHISSYSINNANSITVKMANTAGSGVYGVGIVVEIDDTKTYTLNLSKTGGDATVGWLNSDGSSLSYTNEWNIPVTLTPPSGAKYAMILCCPGRNTEHTFSDIQLEEGTTATPYEPYTANTTAITFGKTVYVGSVNFKTGEVTVTHGMVDLGTLDWKYPTPYFNALSPIDSKGNVVGGIDALSSAYTIYRGTTFSGFTNTNYSLLVNNKSGGNTRAIYCMNTDYTDPAALKTAMSGVQLCYELETPTTLTLTPAELELLKGNNTITANGAEISIKYYPDNAIGALAERVDDLDNAASNMQVQIDSKVPICKTTVDLSSLDQDTYYPVTGTVLSKVNNLSNPHRICVNVALNSGTKPSWSTHNAGFSVTLDVLVQGGDWGTQRAINHILIDTFSNVSGNISPCAYSQMSNSSTPVIWCRGGGKYFIYTDYDSDWTVRTSTYAVNGQSVSPTTTKPTNQMVAANGYFGGTSENAYHVMDSWSNTRGLNIRWAGPGYTTADYIPAFNTAGTEIGPLSLVTLGKLLNIVGNYSTSYTDFNDFPHGSIVQAYGSAAHAPGNALHYYVVFTYYIANATTYKLQLAIENGSGNVYTRDCTNGTWEDWNLILKQDALETKYLHYISIQRYNNDAATIDVTIPIINNTAAIMTKTEILTYLDEHEQHIKPIHGMYHNIYQGNFVLPEPIVDFVYTYYEGSEDKRLIFYRFENDDVVVTPTNSYLRIEDRFVVQIVQNA